MTVVAPDRNCSGASTSLTIDHPLHIYEHPDGRISVEGTPTDCVHLAITGILEHTPDMVITGINEGANLGDDVWYSGTVAAALEGRTLGYPAIAFSLDGKEHYATAAHVAKQLVLNIENLTPEEQTLLNVNIPDVPLAEIKGIMITRLGTRHKAEPTIKQTDPRGRTIYWIGKAGPAADAGEGTDFYAIKNNFVSITPIRIDLSKTEKIADLNQWIKNIEL